MTGEPQEVLFFFEHLILFMGLGGLGMVFFFPWKMWNSLKKGDAPGIFVSLFILFLGLGLVVGWLWYS